MLMNGCQKEKSKEKKKFSCCTEFEKRLTSQIIFNSLNGSLAPSIPEHIQKTLIA